MTLSYLLTLRLRNFIDHFLTFFPFQNISHMNLFQRCGDLLYGLIWSMLCATPLRKRWLYLITIISFLYRTILVSASMGPHNVSLRDYLYFLSRLGLKSGARLRFHINLALSIDFGLLFSIGLFSPSVKVSVLWVFSLKSDFRIRIFRFYNNSMLFLRGR